jgi:hypothetical protein
MSCLGASDIRDFSVGSLFAYYFSSQETMSGRKFCQLRAACCILAVALLVTLGCRRSDPVQKVTPPPVKAEVPTSEPVATRSEVTRLLPAEPELLEGSGVTAWAHEFPGVLIAGLDGGLYVPYKRITIEGVQKALQRRGLYVGPVNGVLDRPTMKSIYEFQQANINLQRCGIPTPHTRNLLEQGSHTDLTS